MSVRWKLSALGLASAILAFLASGFGCLFGLPYAFFPNPFVLIVTGILAFLALGCVFTKRLRWVTMEREVTWLLKKDRRCKTCGTVFPKRSSVGKFLRHVQGCRSVY